MKLIIFEVLETLVTICWYLDYESRRGRNPYGQYMRGHADGLKHYSKELHAELFDDMTCKKGKESKKKAKNEVKKDDKIYFTFD